MRRHQFVPLKAGDAHRHCLDCGVPEHSSEASWNDGRCDGAVVGDPSPETLIAWARHLRVDASGESGRIAAAEAYAIADFLEQRAGVR